MPPVDERAAWVTIQPLQLQRFEFDRAYIDRLVDGDPETEGHFVRYFGDLLTLKLRSRLRSPTLVEDARQETFRRVLTTLKEKGGLASAGSLGAFVNSVCNNVLFECYRAGAKVQQLAENHEQADDRRPSAELGVMAAEQRDRVRTALAGLPDKEREILRWLFFEERDKDEICRELNVDRNYLRVLVHRAKAKFKERFLEVDEA
jgi:RNA polymerase sigma-70 factor (ECF subfamily)